MSNMRKSFLLKTMLLLCALVAGMSNVWADDQTLFDVTTASNWETSSNTYSSTIWSSNGCIFVQASNYQKGWAYVRLGGKSLTKVDAYIGTTTATTIRTKQLDVTVEQAKSNNSLTINSITLYVYRSYNSSTKAYSDEVEHISYKVSDYAAGTMTFETASDDYWDSGVYYKLVYNLSNSKTTNYGTDVSKLVAKEYTGGGSTPSITASNINIDYNATNGSIAYTLQNGTGNVSATVTSGDWLTVPNSNNTATEVPFTCEANTGAERTAQVTLSFTGATDKVVTITQAAAPITHTATFSVNGTTTTQDFAEGAAISFPSAPAVINGKKFMGWVDTEINGTTDNAPEFVTSATMSTNDVTFYAVFAAVTPGTATTKTDELTTDLLGDYSSYSNWFDKSDSNGSDAKYAGCTMTTNNDKNIQINTSTDNSKRGIISTTSGGTATKVTVTWGNGNSAGRSLVIYGSNDAYTTVSAFNTSKGTELGSITYGTSTELIISGNYKYLGFYPTGAIYMEKIAIDWQTGTPDTYSAYCTSVGAAVAVTGVTLDPTSQALYVGDEFDLTATVAPANATDKSITWTSSDETKATVVNGHVTALAAGTPTITVTTTDGSFTATCDLTISNVAVTGVSLNKTSATIFTGSIGNTVQLAPTIAPANATITEVNWTSSDETKATVSSTGLVTAVAVGTATITVTTTDGSFTATCAITVENAPGSAEKPYTVAQAREAIDAGTGMTDVYVKGIVSLVGNYSNNKYVTYWISDDGTKTNHFQVFKGLGLNGADFSAATDIVSGDKVIVYGNITLYNNTTYEFEQGSQLVSKETLNFAFGEDSYSVEYGGDLTITASSNNSSGAITYSSSATDVAEINASTGVVTAKKEGETTITATIAAADGFPGKRIDITLTVTDSRADAEISFANATVTKTWGESFTGQPLTNTNSVDVVWSSTDETVATVDNTGAVTVLKAGSTDIKATFAGDATYKAAVASYTLTVNKAAAGLSYTTTSFEIMLNDNSFVAPTLNNPNSLTGITYASNNADVAIVADENTGQLVYDKTKEGTATITATFAGNDWYESGSANYTITIIDPTVKGGKYNPYTVAELIDGTATGNGIYVKGFIVGRYVGNTTAPQTSSFSDNGNIAIAGEFTSSPTATASAPIQLGTDALKNAWGCKATSGALLGYEVLIKGNKDSYFSVNGIKNTSEISAVSIPLSQAKEYTTLTSKFALDFTSVSGNLKAYIVFDDDVSDHEVTMTEVYKVPAETGLVLKTTTPDATVNVPVFDGTGADNVTGNLMVGSATAETHVDANAGYILSNGVFQPALEGNLPIGKAYLNIPVNSSARALTMSFEEPVVTGISNNNRETIINNRYYNLNGQRVQTPKKGSLYIQNGKKVVKN